MSMKDCHFSKKSLRLESVLVCRNDELPHKRCMASTVFATPSVSTFIATLREYPIQVRSAGRLSQLLATLLSSYDSHAFHATLSCFLYSAVLDAGLFSSGLITEYHTRNFLTRHNATLWKILCS